MAPTPSPLGARPLLLGVVHLAPLPGSPGWLEVGPNTTASRRRQWLSRAIRDAEILGEAGFHGVIVENYGDAPFYAGRVPAETLAAMSVAAQEVRRALSPRVTVGVNVLRNDARAAMAIAAAARLDFVRVNVLTGAALTDQGVIEGEAADVLRDRARLTPATRVLADLRVKHATPLAERPLFDEAWDLLDRGGADALVLTGSRTGEAVDRGELESLRSELPEDALLLAGSGATASTVTSLLEVADGVIVGTTLNRGGRAGSGIDPRRASRFVKAALA